MPKKQGYAVPIQMLQHATNYMRQVANSWNRTEPWSQQDQAYRLYVLALAGKPDLAAMNRLKETRLQRPVSQWLLASAYALSNQQEIATKMIRDLSFEVTPLPGNGRNVRFYYPGQCPDSAIDGHPEHATRCLPHVREDF